MVELDVRHDRDLHVELEHRAVDSSASTTSQSPAPQSAFRPVVRSAPPIR